MWIWVGRELVGLEGRGSKKVTSLDISHMDHPCCTLTMVSATNRIYQNEFPIWLISWSRYLTRFCFYYYWYYIAWITNNFNIQLEDLTMVWTTLGAPVSWSLMISLPGKPLKLLLSNSTIASLLQKKNK